MIVNPGVYRHHKGKLYLVIGEVVDHLSRQAMVLYVPLYVVENSQSMTVRGVGDFPREVQKGGPKAMTYELDDTLTVSQLLEGGVLEDLKEHAEQKELFDDAVDEFAREMKRKLLIKNLEGYSGGLEPENAGEVMHRLLEHWARFKGGDRTQLVDVANFLMMLWKANATDAVATSEYIRQREEEDAPL